MLHSGDSMKEREVIWIYEIICAFDCLGNAFGGGSAKHTISARVGWRANTKGAWRWRLLQSIIDWAFDPVDGEGHCLAAYKAERTIPFANSNNNLRYTIVFILAVAFATPIGLILRSRSLFMWCKGKLRSNFY